MNAVEFIRRREGFRAKPYLDAAGVGTIGYGTTEITEEEATYLLKSYIRREITPVLENAVTVPLNENQTAALTSLIYNIGPAAFRGSTLLKKLNAGDYEGAAARFAVWRKAGGYVLPGLVKRREAERQLFLS